MDNAKKWMNGTVAVTPIQAGGGAKDGTQRNMLALRDVDYLITAEVRLTKLADRSRCNLGKYRDQIRRRASSGKCFHRPCFGVREFDVNFDFVKNHVEYFVQSGAAPIPYEPLGLMLYDVFDYRQFDAGFKWLCPADLAAAREQFEQSLSGLKKGERTKRLKAYDADPTRRYIGEKIIPRPSFFQAEIHDNIVHCHPDDVQILIQDAEGN